MTALSQVDALFVIYQTRLSMPLWMTYAFNFMIASQGIMFLVLPIRAYFNPPRIPILLDFGKRPWTFWRIGFALLITASLFNTAWMFVESSPWTESLAYLVFVTGLFVTSTYESLQPLYLCDDGMRVLTKTLWWWGPQFLPWSEFKRYEWVDATTLIVNPGWHQITCLIPEEHVGSLKSLLREKVAVDAASLDRLQEQLP